MSTRIFARFLVVAALMFWQGGFTFYAAVVVPVGQSLLGHSGQGLITQQVTVWLNISGAICLVLLLLDLVQGRDPSPWKRRLSWALWLGMAALLIGLFTLHPFMDRLLDTEVQSPGVRQTFRTLHRWYLWLSTIQWALAIGYILLMLQAWKSQDGQAGSKVPVHKNVPQLTTLASPSHRSNHPAALPGL
jgi:hypothetical protein